MAEPLVYIIDDDKANNFLTRIMLEDAGIHNFKQFRLAEDALAELQRVWEEKIEEEYPLLILLDINMPAMDGWGFLNEFRKLPEEFRSLPKIYLLTSSDYHGDLEKVGDFPEVIDYLDKPVTDELAKRLKEKYFSPSFE
jgi:CheY-like chemotaxis protein